MTDTRYKGVLLFGAPGVGKGTQGRILGTVPGFFHLASGDVFRSIDINSQDGRDIIQYTSRGELVPDDLTLKIWKKALRGQIATSKYKPYEDLLILDGIPRSVPQAQLIDEDIDIQLVIHLVCRDEEAMIHRMKRRAVLENRADDASESVIRHRFEVYHRESEAVLQHYPEERVAEVDSMGSPAEVLVATLARLIPVQNQHFLNRDDHHQEA